MTEVPVKMVAFLLLSTILVIAVRLAVRGHSLSLSGSYEAIAHIWCGALIVIAAYEWRQQDRPISILSIACLFAATAFETFMFLNR